MGYSVPRSEFGKQNIVMLDKMSVSFVPIDRSSELKFLVRGEPVFVDEWSVLEILESKDIEILLNLRDDNGEGLEGKVKKAVFWTCDLSHEYITINADYRT